MSEERRTLDLPGLDGSNPLGFLAALGALAVLSETDRTLKLGWHSRAGWRPYLAASTPLEESDVLERLAIRLRGQPVDPTAQRKREASQRRFNVAKRNLKNAELALKALNLRGNRLKEERERLVEPVRLRLERRRKIVLERRKTSVPSPELAIGKKVDLSAEEFRSTAKAFMEGTVSDSAPIGMLAALASESCNSNQCPRTRFDFVDSSGQLAFLEAVLELMARATTERLRATLLGRWRRADQKYSLRFDPAEDRRYALLDRDPTAGNNKSTSEWMANLLAYRGLSFYPCVIVGFKGVTTGWMDESKSASFTWPIWDTPLSSDTIRSLLALQELVLNEPPHSLQKLGVKAIYRSRKVTNGDYVNFSPSLAVL